VQSMLQASFTSDLVLYAASGLLTYGANDGMCCARFSCILVGKPNQSLPACCYVQLRACCSATAWASLMLCDMSGINAI
jgi:hypothetical protein